MTMQAVYNNALRPVVCDADGKLLVASSDTLVNSSDFSHTYTYSGSLLTTDTATNGTDTYVKTYTYTGGLLTSQSKWVKQ